MQIASIVANGSDPFDGPGLDRSRPARSDCPWPPAPDQPAPPTLSQDVLTGSWYLLLLDDGVPLAQGTMRVSVEGGDALAISADLYRTRAGSTATEHPRTGEFLLSGPTAWYPQFHRRDYVQHLRSLGGSVSNETLAVEARAFLWQPSRANGTSNRVGAFDEWVDTTLTLDLTETRHTVANDTEPAPVLRGSLTFNERTVEVWAAKTSPLLRGLRLFVHEMEGRPWPVDQRHNPDKLVEIFRDSGIDLRLCRQTDRIPDDDSLLRSELDALLAEQVARHDAEPIWTKHLFLASALNWSGLSTSGKFGHIVGIMFDDIGRHRQGSAVFLDAKISSSVSDLRDRIDPAVRGQPLGTAPKVLLRTIAHEIGHGLGLRHAATARAGHRGIMNQVQELLRQVEMRNGGDLFPHNAVLAFDATDKRNLGHRPDPEVCPGWGNWNVLPMGLSLNLQPDASPGNPLVADRVLGMELVPKPANELAAVSNRMVLRRVFDLGEPVFLDLILRNDGEEPISVPATVTLANGMCELAVRDPGVKRRRLVGAAQTLCEGTTFETLAPGEQRRHILQIHSAGDQPVFRQSGNHRVELAIHCPGHGWIEAPPVVVTIRREIPGVLSAFAITGRSAFCGAMALGYLNLERGVVDTDALLRSPAYPLGARLAAGVLQIATFADTLPGRNGPRVSPRDPNPLRVDRALAHLRETGVTKSVVLAVAEAIDPLSDGGSQTAEVMKKALW